MNQRSKPIPSKGPSPLIGAQTLNNSRCEAKPGSTISELPLKHELVELCSEIAGVLLRGYSDGKSGRAVRRLIVSGLIEKMKCDAPQAQSLVDLSLELIHLQAYGRFRSNSLELSLLVARGGGALGDLSLN
ncbi:MAG: hypothetical protein P1U81_05715 [Verrucomicrobiales bacterium]|nr:hypothetical protein [bacterium]MDF2375717.1 hypothetical protein [Verrucomicrobiales bacterium]